MIAIANGSATITAHQDATIDVGPAVRTIPIKVNTNTLVYATIPLQIINVPFILGPIIDTNNNKTPIVYTSNYVTFDSLDDYRTSVTPIQSGTIIIHAAQGIDPTTNIAGIDIFIPIPILGQLTYESIDDVKKLARVTSLNNTQNHLVIPPTTILDGNEYTVIGIADYVFVDKLSGTIEFPQTLTFIGTAAFQGCLMTGYLTLPQSLTSIGNSAFSRCGFVGAIILPPLLEHLEDSVFSNCLFTSMAPPVNLRTIGAYAFYNCSIFVYDFTHCEQLSSIDRTAFINDRDQFLDINVYVSGFTYDRIKNTAFPRYVKLHTGVPVSNICFVAGTLVKTDQGELPIETLTRKNTLRDQPIQLTKTMHSDPYLVKIQAYAFSDVPTEDIYMSMNHRVYFHSDRIKARDLVNGETITLVPYYGQPLYNVLVKTHTSMRVHGMRVETLDPTSAIALVYTSRLPPLQRSKIIQQLNDPIHYDDTVTYLKRNQ